LPRLLDQSIGVHASPKGAAFGQGGSSRDRCRHFRDIGGRPESLDRLLNHPKGGSRLFGRGETEQSKRSGQLRLSEGVNSVANPFLRRVRAVIVLGLVGGTIAMAMGAAPASAGLGLACRSATSTPFVPSSDNANSVFA